ncbi:MAG TPA: FtsQ-type POTRA domain-containing protein [Bacillus sp. (in: firmicutes)]|nr:FtsQ-type POTRA domain-containing protein [Bacillus sp. (in: firmicutes)]
MEKGKVILLEDRLPKLKEQRKQKVNRRLIFYISLFFILILLIIYTQSSLSNIARIQVIGNRHVQEKEIISTSGLSDRINYWDVNAEEVEERIESHPEVKEAVVRKKIPNTVEIQIKEYARVAYVVEKGRYLPITEKGKVLKAVKGTPLLSDAPLLINWDKPEVIQEMVEELNKLPKSIVGSISEIHYTPEESDSLHINLYMNDGREVSASIRNFSEQMIAYPSIVSQLDSDMRGVIDLELDGLYYFDAYEGTETKEEEKNETER